MRSGGPPDPLDVPTPTIAVPEAASSSSMPGASISSHVCIGKDARMELLRTHGTQFGDDEIRFHLNRILALHASKPARMHLI